MRAYFFTNFYLNTISQGIQPAHCIVDMMLKYSRPAGGQRLAAQKLIDWAENHKTMICLNGGAHADIEEIDQELERLGNALNLPFGSFCEDQYSLGGLKTCCGIVVPEGIYTLAAKKWVDDNTRFVDSDGMQRVISDYFCQSEIDLATLTRSCGLAR